LALLWAGAVGYIHVMSFKWIMWWFSRQI